METTVYLVRHAEPNYRNHDDFSRELTAKGLQDSHKVTTFLVDKTIDKIYSSPYKRAVDTVQDLANHLSLSIYLEENFRERRIDSGWIDDFDQFSKRQWQDFTYKLSDGESLSEVQERNISALNSLISENSGKTIVVGSHGTALSTIVNYYQPKFTYTDFQKLKHLFPFIVKMIFTIKGCQSILLYDILNEDIHETSLL